MRTIKNYVDYSFYRRTWAALGSGVLGGVGLVLQLLLLLGKPLGVAERPGAVGGTHFPTLHHVPLGHRIT